MPRLWVPCLRSRRHAGLAEETWLRERSHGTRTVSFLGAERSGVETSCRASDVASFQGLSAGTIPGPADGPWRQRQTRLVRRKISPLPSAARTSGRDDKKRQAGGVFLRAAHLDFTRRGMPRTRTISASSYNKRLIRRVLWGVFARSGPGKARRFP
jgi:hypothetical protein